MMVFRSSVSSWGLSTLGAAPGPLLGPLPGDSSACMAVGPCTVVWALMSVRGGEVSGCAPCDQGALLSVDSPQRKLIPYLSPRCSAMSLSLSLLFTARMNVYGSRCVCVFVCECVSGYVPVFWGWGGGGVVSVLMLFLASVRHFVLLLKYEKCPINKV